MIDKVSYGAKSISDGMDRSHGGVHWPSVTVCERMLFAHSITFNPWTIKEQRNIVTLIHKATPVRPLKFASERSAPASGFKVFVA